MNSNSIVVIMLCFILEILYNFIIVRASVISNTLKLKRILKLVTTYWQCILRDMCTLYFKYSLIKVTSRHNFKQVLLVFKNDY